ncbi:hypothetical protein IW261DRAFT_1607072 [Armillaria novae-zelandiae]|uniref:Protein kinase domain-containing protein n=1 Tax=Armillaria novae-zelandiae TaxID=153914 RepID=A0AA39PCS6_9AGAR|nr:hypothetical protein IW261DRAFT_1607072 [Armillaria novae-zelandiae]
MPLSSASIIEVIYDHNHVSRLWSWDAVNGINSPDTSPQFTIRCCEALRQRVFRASMGPYGGQPTTPVIIKVARTEQEFSLLQWEEKVYNQCLRGLQGTVVPKCYGLFGTNDRGRKTGCLVLEHCATANDIKHADYCRKVMVAIIKIHQAGIIHGDVRRSSHILSTPDGVRIIDFSNAKIHECPNAQPRLMDTRYAPESGTQCNELMVLENGYGIADGQHLDNMLQTNMPSPLPAVHVHSHRSQYADPKRYKPVRF